jgi:hypothetical protein
VTVGAIVILFAVYAFIVAGTDVMRAFSGDRAGPVVGYLLLAALSVVAAIVALVCPVSRPVMQRHTVNGVAPQSTAAADTSRNRQRSTQRQLRPSTVSDATMLGAPGGAVAGGPSRRC